VRWEYPLTAIRSFHLLGLIMLLLMGQHDDDDDDDDDDDVS